MEGPQMIMDDKCFSVIKYRIRRDSATPMYTTALHNDKDRFKMAAADFALKLFKNLDMDRKKTVIIGPCLAQFPLLSLLVIAEGETKEEIKKVLSMENIYDDYIHQNYQYGYYRLNQNGRRHDQWRPHGIKVWDLHPVYLLMIKRTLLPPADQWHAHKAHAFKAYQNVLHGVRCVDQIGPKEIESVNQFIEKETKKVFPKAIPPDVLTTKDDQVTKLAMVSAINFDGVFINGTNVDKERLNNFETVSGGTVTSFIYNEALKEYAEDENCQVLGLEFVWGSLTLYIFLPKPGVDLQKLEDEMTTDKLINLIKQAAFHRVHKKFLVDYQIPQFTVKQSHDLTAVFRDKLGLATLFDPERINFNTFRTSNVEKPSGVGGVFHNVSFTIKKNMKGELNRFARPLREHLEKLNAPENAEFTADRPFFFVVYDVRAQIFLFMGRFTDPREAVPPP